MLKNVCFLDVEAGTLGNLPRLKRSGLFLGLRELMVKAL